MAGWLVGIVVALAPIDVVRAHGVFFIHPTEVGEVNIVKGVSIFNCSSIDKPHIDIVRDLIKLFLSERRADDIHWQFGSREESSIASKNLRWWSQFQGERQGQPECEHGLAGFGQHDVISWSLPIIFSCEDKVLFLNVAEVFDSAGNKTHISAQLPVLSVARYPSLVAGGEPSQHRNGHSGYFKPRIISFVSAVSLAGGLWLGICGS